MLTDTTNPGDHPLVRCQACGNHANLHACAGSVVSGPVQADGTVAEHSSEQFETYEDSMECTVHLGGEIEYWDGSNWCSKVACSHDEQGRRFGIYACGLCDSSGNRWVPNQADASPVVPSEETPDAR